MKRLLLTLALVLFASGANAQMRVSDVLLTEDGTLFSIDTVSVSDFERESEVALDTPSTIVLRLRIQRGEGTETVVVPGSLVGGSHLEPTLAWDDADQRLYVFWQRMPGIGASELLFASYKGSEWSDVETFDGGSWRIRFNLKVAITRFAEYKLEDGSIELRPALIAHAIWWEQFGEQESARYAMLDLEQGEVRSVQIHDLTDFVTRTSGSVYTLPEDYDRNILRTPFLFESPEGNSVDVLFADWNTNLYQLVNIRPVDDEQEGVLHIPTGVTRDEINPSPIHVRSQSAELVALRPNPSSGRLVLYSNNGDSIDWTELRSGSEWSTSNVLRIDSATTVDTALEALRRRAAKR